MPRYIEVVPAYDRDYTSKAAVQADWDSGKDFLTRDLFVRGYLNCDDATDDMVVNVRYDELRKVHPIDVGKWRASRPAGKDSAKVIANRVRKNQATKSTSSRSNKAS